jgi:hypothetical protein
VTLPVHGHRIVTLSRALLAGALLASALLAAPARAHAVSTLSGGWYWPVATEDFQGWGGWWQHRSSNHSYHMAQDMPAPVGHSVYAIADGTVLESEADAHYGGVIVVLHRTAEGQYFKAVYGHIKRASGTAKGAKVSAGQVVGRVNSARHVHFGIHPGRAYPYDNNPFRGHTYDSHRTYDWVDPVAFLRANPRVITVPAVPVIASVDTTGPPDVIGVAGDRVYWSVEEADERRVYGRAIAGIETAPVADDTQLRFLDGARYAVASGPAAFALSDRLPALSMTASSPEPSWKHSVVLSGILTNAAHSPFVGARIVLESSADGVTWTRLATVLTGPTGRFSLRWTPSRRVGVRARYAGAATFLPGTSDVTTVAPRARLTAPAVPSGARHGRTFSVSGTLAPRHPAGIGTVAIRVQHRVHGVWCDSAVVPATCRDSSGGSKYSAVLKLATGSWRVRAETGADAAHAAGTGSWSAFTFR